MGREEHFQNGQTFTEVRQDWQFHDTSIWRSHQTTHTGQLGEVRDVTPGSRVHHHNDRVLRILVGNQTFFQFLTSRSPLSSNCIVAFVISNHTSTELLGNLIHSLVGFFNNLSLIFNNWDISDTHCQTSQGRMVITQVLQAVKKSRCFCSTEAFKDFRNDIS